MTNQSLSPIRIQRKRTKGWKMPENTVYVGRPGKWGNPFVPVKKSLMKEQVARERSVHLYECALKCLDPYEIENIQLPRLEQEEEQAANFVRRYIEKNPDLKAFVLKRQNWGQET